MFCSNCGFQVNHGGNFCSSCGSKLALQQATGENTFNDQTITHVQSSPNNNGTVFVILGWVFFAISLIFIPILFGAGAFIMGYLVRKNSNETHGTILMVMAIAGAVLGMLIGIAVSPYVYY